MKARSAVAAASLLMGCSGISAAPASDGAAAARVTGSVTYVERIALAPTAEVRVQLVDVSRVDAPATVLGEQIITAGGRQVPFAFEIAYDPSKIDSRHTYAVQARIEVGGRLRFVSDQRYAVITRGAPSHVDVTVKPCC